MTPSTPSAGQALPSGTVTFLLTDIEGRTNMIRQSLLTLRDTAKNHKP